MAMMPAFRLLLLSSAVTGSAAAFCPAPHSKNHAPRHAAVRRHDATVTHQTRPPFGMEDTTDDRHVDIRAALDRMQTLQSGGSPPPGMEELQRRISKTVSRRESSIVGAGQGIFATRNIKAGVIVGFYPVHGIGADFTDASSVCIGETLRDQEYFDADASGDERANYIQYLIGSRRIGTAEFGTDTRLYVDVNPGRIDSGGGWITHYINDGATVATNSEGGMLDYYVASRQCKNCVNIPFGPAPLIATVTTRKIKKGEELFTSYGCLYWIESLLQEGEECADVTEAVQMEAKQAAQDLFTAMQNARTTYATQQAELQETFAGL